MKLGGRGDKLVLGGISLGGATAIWSLLCSDTARRLGAFFAASTWLPFHNNIKRLANIMASSSTNTEPQFGLTDSDKFVENTIAPFLRSHASTQAPGPLMSTPVFIGHGSDDAYVDVILGRQARDVLRQFGFNVEWREYSGADQEGHWLKCPEEVDDIASFLSAQLT
jgi:acetyl esterase/lipase